MSSHFRNRLFRPTHLTEKKVKMSLTLGFEMVFPDEEPRTPTEYMTGGNKDVVLNIASYFLGFKSQNSIYQDNRRFIEIYFSPRNNDIANVVYQRIKQLERQYGDVTIINPVSSLKLFELFYNLPESPQTQSNEEFEINLLKAYLVVNSELNLKQESGRASVNNLDPELKVPMLAFRIQYPISDKINYDLAEQCVTQIIKAIYLFEYLESHETTRPLLQAFLAHFERPSWQEYLKSFIPLALFTINNEKEAHTDIVVPPGDNFEESCRFIDKVMIQENEELLEHDFLTLRSKPIYKIEDGTYRIIFNLFVVEKIFKGLYFLLRDVNSTLPRGQKISDLKGIYNHQFSEKTLMYRILETIYPNVQSRLSGEQLDAMAMSAAPDYYIRKGKNILLFESKDFLIRADYRMTYNFDVYDREIGKTCYYEERANGNIKNGAVLQLIGNIKRLLTNDFLADRNYRYREAYIYPILITHDLQYDTIGFNALVNYWFQQELMDLQEEGLFTNRVKPLTVINIDVLLFHQMGLRESMPLHEVIDEYLKHIFIKPGLNFDSFEDYQDYRLSKTMPFSLFINLLFMKKGIRQVPPVLELVAPALFNEE